MTIPAPDGHDFPPVTGLGDPVLDIVAKVPHALLSALQAEPGGSVRVKQQEMDRLLALPEVQHNSLRVPGGSAANVMKGLAGLAAGRRQVRFMGMLGPDTAGAEYRKKLSEQGVDGSLLLQSPTSSPTGTCLCLVTPDGQRTMRTCLCASLELCSPAQLPLQLLPPGGLLHCEGYCLYRPAVAEGAMRAVRQSGGRVSLDLASFEVVRACYQALLGLLEQSLVDLVFCNEQEAGALAQAAGLAVDCSDPEQVLAAVQSHLLQYCSVVVCSRGAKGCVARSRAGESAAAPAGCVQVVDTVGAGDHFTAGFLHGWLQGGSLAACAACGCAAGTVAVQVAGAALGQCALRQLRSTVAGLLAGSCTDS